MRRPLKYEEMRLWAVVAATVRPIPGRSVPKPPEPEHQPTPVAAPAPLATATAQPLRRPLVPASPGPIEPGRRRRLVRERDPIHARIDLHGLDQDQARASLLAFLKRAQADGVRAVLVITGKGSRGDGVLRRRAPDWLAEPQMREVVAGFSPAHRRHGGEGAFYVALKRLPSR